MECQEGHGGLKGIRSLCRLHGAWYLCDIFLLLHEVHFGLGGLGLLMSTDTICRSSCWFRTRSQLAHSHSDMCSEPY